MWLFYGVYGLSNPSPPDYGIAVAICRLRRNSFALVMDERTPIAWSAADQAANNTLEMASLLAPSNPASKFNGAGMIIINTKKKVDDGPNGYKLQSVIKTSVPGKTILIIHSD